MGVFLKKSNGKLLPEWYGEFIVNGKRKIVNLSVPWDGTPVESMRDHGDTKFERSRGEAKAELKRVRAGFREKGRAEHLTERLIEAKTGQKLEYVKLSELAEKWRSLPRERSLSDAWLACCDAAFTRLAADLPVKYLYEVTPKLAADYTNSIRKTYAQKTAHNTIQLLRSAFARFLPTGMKNPFDDCITRRNKDDDGDMVHRRPFTAEELTLLLAGAREDPFLYPLVVTAACTGLRRGDVCCLSWKAVNLRANVISVKTSKTGATVEIPIFPPLRAVLDAALAERQSDHPLYVWPAAAAMHKENPDGLTWRFKKLVAASLPEQPEDVDMPDADDKPAPAPAAKARLKDVLQAVCDAVDNNVDSPRRERILGSLKLYAEGKSLRDIEDMTGQARSGISGDLHLAEDLSKFIFMPVFGSGVKRRLDRMTRQGKPGKKPKGRKRRASVLDWHALRVTWVTLALAAGVPMELTRLVTGHKTVEVVLRHYFKPNREHLRNVLSEKLPSVLTGAEHGEDEAKTPDLPLEDLLAKVTAKKASPEEIKRLSALLAESVEDKTTTVQEHSAT